MDSTELVSVIVSTYNRSDALLAVLTAFTRQTDRHFEVIVADDGSTPTHQQRILQSDAARMLKLTHVWHPDVGFTLAKIRNRGVAASCGNYIVFLDGDCVPENDFIARHRLLAQSGHFCNGSRILLSPELTSEVVVGAVTVDGRGWGFWLRQRLGGNANKLVGHLRLPNSIRRTKPYFRWKGIRGCNMAMWKSDFEKIDGYDESFNGWGHEDADLVLRLHNSGVVRKNGFCSTEVFHLWHKEANRGTESVNAQRVRQRAEDKTTRIVRSTLGYAQKRMNDDVVVTRTG